MFSLWLYYLQTLSTIWKEMGIKEKEWGFPVFDTDIIKLYLFIFIFSTAEITARLLGKIGAHLLAAEWLNELTVSNW